MAALGTGLGVLAAPVPASAGPASAGPASAGPATGSHAAPSPAQPDTRAAAPPAVAYRDGTVTRAATATGSVTATVPAFDVASLGGGLLVGSTIDDVTRRDTVRAYDHTTGRPAFTIPNAFAPVALPGGAVAFLPDRAGRRDVYQSSVWLRSPSGAVRTMVRFSTSPGAPGYPIRDLDGPTQLAVRFDRAGARMVVVEGNDVDLFEYDTFVVDVASGAVRRLTTDHRSRLAAISPAGDRVVVQREHGTCGAAYLRTGDVQVMTSTGAGKRVIRTGSCSRWYQPAGWVSGTGIAAIRLTRTALRTWRSDLVVLSARTGRVLRVRDGSGHALPPSVSVLTGALAWERTDRPGFTLRTSAGAVRRFPTGGDPHVLADRTWR